MSRFVCIDIIIVIYINNKKSDFYYFKGNEGRVIKYFKFVKGEFWELIKLFKLLLIWII